MLSWFISPTGKRVTVEAALERGALADYYPLAYLRVCAQEREWTGKPSTTQLLRGTREAYFKIHFPYAIDPGQQGYRILGSTSHMKLEEMADPDYAEQGQEDDISSGVWDMIEQVHGENWLLDYKTAGAFTIARFLGLREKKVPMKNDQGEVIRYQRNGKNYKRGDIRYEKKFIKTSERDDFEWTYQLNRYRILAEQTGIKIHRMKIFAIIRDAGTWKAKNWGIDQSTMYIDIQHIADDVINSYFQKKAKHLISHKKSDEEILLQIKPKNSPVDIVLAGAPPVCSDKENWSGKKCQNGYCPVAEYCAKKGDNPYLKGKKNGH